MLYIAREVEIRLKYRLYYILYSAHCTPIARAAGINYYTPTAIMLARYVTNMNTQSPGGICYASLEVGWYSKYQPTSTKA